MATEPTAASGPRFERPPRPLTGPRQLRDDLGPIYAANGLIGLIFAATGPVAVILAVGRQGGLSQADIASWVFGVFFLNGVLTVLACWVYRQPLAFFWTIPGTVLVGPALAHLAVAPGRRGILRHGDADALARRDRLGSAGHGPDSDADRDGHGGGGVPALRHGPRPRARG